MTHRSPPVAVAILVATAVGCSDGASSSGLPECDSSQLVELFTNDDTPETSLGQCLSRTLKPAPTGQVSCLALELRKTETPEACACDAANGRIPVSKDHAGAKDIALEHEAAAGAGWNCFCEVIQLEGDARNACTDDISAAPTDGMGEPVRGFCYVDATTVPVTGNPELVKDCPETERRALRFLGDPAILPQASLIMICSEENCN
jgi:hypothetical protein